MSWLLRKFKFLIPMVDPRPYGSTVPLRSWYLIETFRQEIFNNQFIQRNIQHSNTKSRMQCVVKTTPRLCRCLHAVRPRTEAFRPWGCVLLGIPDTAVLRIRRETRTNRRDVRFSQLCCLRFKWCYANPCH
jgi:hypothetical protein